MTLPRTASEQARTADCVTAGTDRAVIGRYGRVGRSLMLPVPAGYEGGKPVALLIDLHSYNLDANQRPFSGQLEEANRRGFIVAWAKNIDNDGILSCIIEAVDSRR